MKRGPFDNTQLAVAIAAAIGTGAVAMTPAANANERTPGRYVAGDFHNHTTCSDGTISMQKLVKKATDKTDTPWGLDWFVQAGHGGNGNRNCTLVEDASLSTPAFPFDPTLVPAGGDTPGSDTKNYVVNSAANTTWAASIGAANVKGTLSGKPESPNMWRWQSIQEFQYPLMEYLSASKHVPLFIGMESVVAGHEHSSMSVIAGQMPRAIDTAILPTTPGYAALGNANALSQWSYCFDRGDTDTSRGNSLVTGTGNNWDCSVAGSLNSADPSWNATGLKLIPAVGAGSGILGHQKTLEGLKWMAEKYPAESYYIPAHLERAGPFNPDNNNGYNVEHLRDFNNAAPKSAFGFETQPGHGASSERGEYFPGRNNFGTSANPILVDSVGGTTYGGTGVYGAQVGGVWDALLGEGRNFWFFASSDWHNRGKFGPDDRRSTQDFFPGEYQRNYTLVRNGRDKIRPQGIVDGLRSGNNWESGGQLIDRLSFIACAVYGPSRPTPLLDAVANAVVEGLALGNAANDSAEIPDTCATMGEKLVVRPGADIIVGIVVRDPAGKNYSPYSFPNPSLLQIGTIQPLNEPVLDHLDLIQGLVTGYKVPGAADYSGEWPRTWLANPDLSTVPDAAKNTTAAVIKTFNSSSWKTGKGDFMRMVYRIPAVKASQYVRLRGTNLPASVPFETDANGNPLPDLYTNATTTNPTTGAVGSLRIPCTTVGTNVPAIGAAYPAGSAPIDGCPSHLPQVNGVKYVAYDVAAWSDLWFYSNPIYIEVKNSTRVAGVK